MKADVKMGVYTHKGKSVNFNFYTTVPMSKKFQFINYVVNVIVGETYNCFMKDMIFDFAIIRYLTDVDVSDIISSEYIEELINSIEALLEETDIVSVVKANDVELLKELYDAVNKNIEYRTGIHENTFENSLSQLMKTIEKKFENMDIATMMDAAKAMKGIENFTPTAFIDAFSKSDAFKNRHREIFEEQQLKNQRVAEAVVRNAKKS